MAKTKIFITQPIAQSAIDRLEARGDVELKIYPDASKIIPYDTLLEEVKGCDILYCLLHDVNAIKQGCKDEYAQKYEGNKAWLSTIPKHDYSDC